MRVVGPIKLAVCRFLASTRRRNAYIYYVYIIYYIYMLVRTDRGGTFPVAAALKYHQPVDQTIQNVKTLRLRTVRTIHTCVCGSTNL